MSNEEEQRHAGVAEYYGKTLRSNADLRTSACCPIDTVPEEQRSIVAKLHSEVTSRFYGCGSPIPSALTGATLLDLGCGTGRDAFVASALVGKYGRVIGVDMTESQLEVAERHRSHHASMLLGEGVPSNVEFRVGLIENLQAAGIADNSIDVVISNCVCNLVSDKRKVWREVARVLKQGGELYFSDVYSDRRLSESAASHPTLIAECLGGALYIEDFRRSMADAGFLDLRVVSCAPVTLLDTELRALVEDVNFYSITARLFKIDGLEDRREDFGQKATYHSPNGLDSLKLDQNFTFPVGVPVDVDGNTAKILRHSRYKNLFKVTDPCAHKGLFDAENQFSELQTMSSKCCPPKARLVETKPQICCDPTEIQCCEKEVDTKAAVDSSRPPMCTKKSC